MLKVVASLDTRCCFGVHDGVFAEYYGDGGRNVVEKILGKVEYDYMRHQSLLYSSNRAQPSLDADAGPLALRLAGFLVGNEVLYCR